MRQAHNASHHFVRDLNGCADTSNPRFDTGRAAIGQAEAAGIVWMHLQRAVGAALDQDVDVVHPRVDRLQMAAANQHQLLAVLGVSSEATGKTGEVVEDWLRRKLDCARHGFDHVGEALHERAEVGAARMLVDQLLKRESIRVAAKAVAMLANAQLEVDDLLGPCPRFERSQNVVLVAAKDWR